MSRNTIRTALVVLTVGILLSATGQRQWLSAVAGRSTHCATTHPLDAYPYQSSSFDRLIRESYGNSSPNASAQFYAWMEKAYRASRDRLPGTPYPTLKERLRVERRHLARLSSASARAHEEIILAAWTHAFIRAALPVFSLERGFEFRNAVKYGERQCFLQSVLAAGLLQRMGVRAGVVMVYRSERGEESNNGHAVALVKLSNRQDVIMDASHAEPFVRQQGLFAKRADYAYVDPMFIRGTAKILLYKASGNGRRISPSRIRPLDYAFVRSQFYYYRGERAEGGLLASVRTPCGISASARNLRTSVRLCPKNPLAVYMLGRACLCQGNVDGARTLLERANRLYGRFGWVPPGAVEYLDLARRPSSVSPKS